MMPRFLSITVALLLLAAPALADEVTDAEATAEPGIALVAYSDHTTPTLFANTSASALPTVQLMSANHADVLKRIDAMRARLSDYASLALDNGISQTADAFVEHWNLAVETNVRNDGVAVQIIIGDMASHSSVLIDDFLSTSSVPTEPSLFLQPSFTDAVAVASMGGFFAN